MYFISVYAVLAQGRILETIFENVQIQHQKDNDKRFTPIPFSSPK
jgi:hypothetical protein